MAYLQLKHIDKHFGSINVINDLSLSIKDGEFVVLVGPSGCGKSTLLRMIAGLETISAGDLFINGVRTNKIPPQERDISMVFQSYALFPHMNVRSNIHFGPRIRGEPRDKAKEGLRRASDILGLSDYLDRRPRQLSGGQRQRVAMARSIVRDPRVFLFDEPLSNLDAKLRIQMRTEIKALHQKLGTTIIYVTHDQIEAMTMADRIVVMNSGNIEQIGKPLDLYDHPENIFVAGFIGSPAMSFLEGRVERHSEISYVMLAENTRLPISKIQAPDGAYVKVGIRPESYVRDDHGPLALTAEVVEPTGSEIHVFGRLIGTEVRVVFRDRRLPKPGETIQLSVPPECLHLFDAERGNRFVS